MSELVERDFQISISEIGFRLVTVSLDTLYYDRVRGWRSDHENLKSLSPKMPKL